MRSLSCSISRTICVLTRWLRPAAWQAMREQDARCPWESHSRGRVRPGSSSQASRIKPHKSASENFSISPPHSETDHSINKKGGIPPRTNSERHVPLFLPPPWVRYDQKGRLAQRGTPTNSPPQIRRVPPHLRWGIGEVFWPPHTFPGFTHDHRLLGHFQLLPHPLHQNVQGEQCLGRRL